MKSTEHVGRAPALAAAFALSMWLCVPLLAQAASYYAANTGSPAGDGSIGDPWDLQTALIGGAPTGTVQPGDTIWVRGGVYLGPYTPYLKGTPAQPIIVRNYGGERVIIDGQYAYCDPSFCPPEEWQAAHPWFPTCSGPGGSGVNYQCNAFNGINPCDPTTNPACVAPFNYRLDTLTIPRWSHDVWIWGFDLTDYTDAPRGHIPAFCTAENPPQGCCFPGGVLHQECFAPPQIPQSRASPVWIEGDRVRLINSAVHDRATGVSWFTRSENSEVYGTLVFNNGFAGALRGMHHGCYTQNVDAIDIPSEKAFRESVFYSNYGIGMQIYGSCGPADHYSLEGVVSFSTTLPAKEFYSIQDPAIIPVEKSKESQDSILLGANRSSHHGTIRSTYVYNPMDEAGIPTFDHGTLPLHISNFSDILVEDSVFAGDGDGAVFNQVAQIRFQRNTVVGRTYSTFKAGSVTIIDPQNLLHIPLHEFADNAYYRTDGAPLVGIQQGGVGGLEFAVSLPTWQSTYGQDAGTSGYSGFPIANQVFVRPNAYEPGRGNVIIYNWVGLPRVPVDLTPLGLSHGQGFKVHNVQSFKTDPMATDWMGNVAASGTFDSGDPWVDVDMTDTEMVVPIGSTQPLPSTLPEFGVFVVMPQ